MAQAKKAANKKKVTRKSVKKSASRKKTTAPIHRTSRKASVFTPENLKVLKKIYPTTPNIEVAKRLGTTPGTINWKASVLGLRKAKSYMKQMFSQKKKTVKKKTAKKKTVKRGKR